MTSIRFIIDSSSDIDWEFAKEHGIEVVSLNVTYDDQTFKETKDFDLKNFYNQFEEKMLFRPKTSQPTPQDFFQAYKKYAEEGAKEIIVITISSGLSGTLNSARVAKQMFQKMNEEVQIYLVDSLNASYSTVFLLREGMKLAEQGLNAEEIQTKLQENVGNIKNFVLLPTLKHLLLGGRINIAKYLVATVLRKKPIIRVNEEGQNVLATTYTKLETGLNELINLTKKVKDTPPKEVALVHTNDEALALELKEIVKEAFPDTKTEIVLSGVTIGAHTGPSSIALISNFIEE